MENTQDREDKGVLVKFTRWVLLIEFILFAVGLCFPDMHSFFLIWLLAVAIVNAVFIIAHIIERPKRFLLYIALSFAIPLAPVVILVNVISRMGC